MLPQLVQISTVHCFFFPPRRFLGLSTHVPGMQGIPGKHGFFFFCEMRSQKKEAKKLGNFGVNRCLRAFLPEDGGEISPKKKYINTDGPAHPF